MPTERPKLSKGLQSKFRKNRILRRFIDMDIAALREDLAEAKTAPTALEIELKIEGLRAKRGKLPVRRKAQNGVGRRRSGGGIFG